MKTISVLFLSCRRLELLSRTLDSARQHFANVETEVAAEYLCFDNGSSSEDQTRLLNMGFDLVMLGRENLGIGPAMNRLVSMVRTPFVLNLQDDWILENPRAITFVAESGRIFAADKRIGQIKLDLHHFTDFTEKHVYDGPFQAQDGNVEYHVQNPQMQWGGFSFPPAITRTEALWRMGPFTEEKPFQRGWAESEYSARFSKEYVAAKSPQMLLFRHIGDEACSGWNTT